MSTIDRLQNELSPHPPPAGPPGAVGDPRIAPGDIAIGVIIGRASEYFDFFVYGIASVLVFPALFFPFEYRLQGTLYALSLIHI